MTGPETLLALLLSGNDSTRLFISICDNNLEKSLFSSLKLKNTPSREERYKNGIKTLVACIRRANHMLFRRLSAIAYMEKGIKRNAKRSYRK